MRSKTDKWKVQTKIGDGNHDFEISVVKISNKHGQESWGWPDDDKIIFSSDDYSRAMAKKVAYILCEALNNE